MLVSAVMFSSERVKSGLIAAAFSSILMRHRYSMAADRSRDVRGLFSFLGKARTDRDKGSVEPGSRPLFGSVSGSENQF